MQFILEDSEIYHSYLSHTNEYSLIVVKHWFRKCLVAWRHQALISTNIDYHQFDQKHRYIRFIRNVCEMNQVNIYLKTASLNW